jgi:hypothetical protein
VPAIGYGQVQIGSLRLKNVWLVLLFKTTRLISVRTLTRKGFLITFSSNGQAIGKYKANRKAVFKATTENNLYVLQEAQGTFNIATQKRDSQPHPAADQNTNITETDAELWHCRTGHTNYSDLFKLQHFLFGMKLKRQIILVRKKACEACLAGKMQEILSKKTKRRKTIPGRGLHFDITGRIGTSIRGYNYYLLGVNDATRYTWVALLKTLNTDEVLPRIKEIVARVQNFIGNNVA